jgi:hypoxanthine phosphoribosyltransferase
VAGAATLHQNQAGSATKTVNASTHSNVMSQSMTHYTVTSQAPSPRLSKYSDCSAIAWISFASFAVEIPPRISFFQFQISAQDDAMPVGPALITATQIQRRTRALAKEIHEFYDGKDLVILGLLNGCLFFLTDLIRGIPGPVRIECWRLRSYGGKRTTTSGKVEGLKEGFGDFKGRHVLIVDDVLDSGLTLASVKSRLKQLGAKSVRICVLLNKHKKRLCAVKANWAAFDIKDEFVIGYGLDYDGRYRELPDVRVFEP